MAGEGFWDRLKLGGSDAPIDQRSSIVPLGRTTEGEIVPAWPEVALDMYESFKAPSQALRGELSEEELQQRGMQFGMDWMTGGLGGQAVKSAVTRELPVSDSINMLLGPKAQNAPRGNMRMAEAFHQQGVSPDTIWKATGVDVDQPDVRVPIYDGMTGEIVGTKVDTNAYRWEVPDKEIAANIKLPGRTTGLLKPEVVLGKDNFFTQNYPKHAAMLRYRFAPPNELPGGAYGYYDPNSRQIVINSSLSDEDQIDTILHETQHAIQHIDGYNMGDSPDNYIKSQPDGIYNRATFAIRTAGGLLDVPEKVWPVLRDEIEFRKMYMEEAMRRGLTDIDPDAIPVSPSGEKKMRELGYSDRHLDQLSESAKMYEALRANFPDTQPDRKAVTDLFERASEVYRWTSAFGRYERNLGEIQARMTGIRLHMNDESLRNVRPSDDRFFRYSNGVPGRDYTKKFIPKESVVTDKYSGPSDHAEEISQFLSLNDYKEFMP